MNITVDIGGERAVRRVFVAIDVPDEVKDSIIAYQHELEKHVEGNFVRRENLHITVFFIGNRKFDIGLLTKFAGTRRLDKSVRIGGLDAFPDMHTPKVLFLQVNADLGEVHDEIADLLGLGDRKAFVPHFTICRVKRVMSELPDTGTVWEFRAENLHVYGSDFRDYYRLV